MFNLDDPNDAREFRQTTAIANPAPSPSTDQAFPVSGRLTVEAIHLLQAECSRFDGFRAKPDSHLGAVED